MYGIWLISQENALVQYLSYILRKEFRYEILYSYGGDYEYCILESDAV